MFKACYLALSQWEGHEQLWDEICSCEALAQGERQPRGFHPLVHWPCVHRLFSNTTGVLAALMAPVTQYLLLQKVYSFLSTFTGALLAYFFLVGSH